MRVSTVDGQSTDRLRTRPMRNVSLRIGVGLLLGVLAACSQQAAVPAGPKTLAPPKNPPHPMTLLADTFDENANTVEMHVLITPQLIHAQGDELLKFLYRHVMTRTDPPPTGMVVYLYNAEAQYKTPPRSPVGFVEQKAGAVGPTFENKIVKELKVQIDESLSHSDKGWKLEKKWSADEGTKTVKLTAPFTETGKDEWAPKITFNQAVNGFTDTANELFDKAPDLRVLEYTATYKDAEVLRAKIDRATWTKLDIMHVEDQVGQVHGRAYLELSTGKGDKQVSKATDDRIAGVYKKMLSQLPEKPFVAPTLK